MRRRTFVKSSLLAGSLTSIAISEASATDKSDVAKKTTAEVYELRMYTLKNATQQQLVEDYFRTAAIPALNKLGSKHVGVFTELKPEGQSKLYVLIPYPSVSHFINTPNLLDKDAAYKRSGAAYITAPASEPAYERIQSSLMSAFTGMPRLFVPQKKDRIFELRRYESASEAAGKKKIEMFNDAGEIEIFKRVGLTPVFFGETIIGEMLPNLTYMITFDSMEAHDNNWKKFGADPDWNRIKALPEYEDKKIVSRITRTFLTPTSFSQI